MSKYTAKTPIKLNDDERVEEGAELELTDKQAKPLLAIGAVEAVKPAKPAKSDDR